MQRAWGRNMPEVAMEAREASRLSRVGQAGSIARRVLREQFRVLFQKWEEVTAVSLNIKSITLVATQGQAAGGQKQKQGDTRGGHCRSSGGSELHCPQASRSCHLRPILLSPLTPAASGSLVLPPHRPAPF